MEREDHLLKRMKKAAESVQAVVSEVKTLDEAFSYAVELTREQGGRSIAAPGLSPSQLRSFSQRCRENGVALFAENLRRCPLPVHTGFTMVDWGIAETGTLVLNSGREDVRLAATFSQVHVAALHRSRIHPDVQTLERELSWLMRSSPRFLTFVTGPSRREDMGTAAVGVHGPEELHILILESDP